MNIQRGDPDIQWGVEPTIDDLVWITVNMPCYRDKAFEHQLKVFEKYKEVQKALKWDARQKLQVLEGCLEPFFCYTAGFDL